VALETLLFKFLYPCGGYFGESGVEQQHRDRMIPNLRQASRRLIRRPARPYGTSNYFKDRITTASWPRRGAWCLRHRVKAISSRWMPRRENSYGDIKPGNMMASPMSFAVDGRQYVAVASGDSIYCFALPE